MAGGKLKRMTEYLSIKNRDEISRPCDGVGLVSDGCHTITE